MGKPSTDVFLGANVTDRKEKPVRTQLSHGVDRKKRGSLLRQFGRKKSTIGAELDYYHTFCRRTSSDTYTKQSSKLAVAHESTPNCKLLPRNTLF